jgi:predicted nuclease with TOPRIM domain
MASKSENEVIAQEVSALHGAIEAVEKRLDEVERVIARLEAAALTTARALQEISMHWDAVYEAMRRPEEPDVGQLRGSSERSRPRKRGR